MLTVVAKKLLSVLFLILDESTLRKNRAQLDVRMESRFKQGMVSKLAMHLTLRE